MEENPQKPPKGCIITIIILIILTSIYFIFYKTTNETSGSVSITQASIIAQNFVEQNFASDCDFYDYDVRGEETITPNRFKVLQKFTAERLGYQQEYVYRIYVQYYGGEWEDVNNWDYGQLIIENTLTGEQYVYHGTMKDKDVILSGSVNIAGIDFEIAEKRNTAIRIYADRKLSINEFREVCKELRKSYDVIQIGTINAHDRGDEYMALTGGYFFEYSTNTMIKESDFLFGKNSN